jgi:hypothetical protein
MHLTLGYAAAAAAAAVLIRIRLATNSSLVPICSEEGTTGQPCCWLNEQQQQQQLSVD